MRSDSFKKTVTLLVAVCLCFAVSFACADMPLVEQVLVDSVEITGNLTVSDSQILGAAHMRAGDVFTEQAVKSDVERIAKIEGVEYAYYNLKTLDNKVAVTYVVVEKNLVRKIVFRGNDELSDNYLQDKLTFNKGDYVEMFKINYGREAILEEYNKKGYAFATVEIDTQMLSTGRVVYIISEGARVVIKDICFKGNYSIKSKELRKELKTKKKKFFILRSYYTEQNVEEDIQKLSEIYQDRGFLDAKFDVETDFTSDNKKVVLTYTVDEGPVYFVNKIEVEGYEFFSCEELTDCMKLVVSEPYTNKKADYDRRHIEKIYKKNGFVDATVTHERIFTAPGKILARFVVEEGERFRIGRIDITGNQETHDKVVRRVLDEAHFKPGKFYDADAARGDGSGTLEKDVARTALGEAAFITATEGDDCQKNAVVNITEGQTGMVMFGAGVDSSSGLIGQVILDQKNFDIQDWPESFSEFIRGQAFKGAGQKMRISLEPGTEVSRYSITFSEPYLFDKPVGFSMAASKFERDRDSYDEERMSGFVTFERRYDDDWRFGVKTRVENVDITSVDADAPKEVFDDAGENTFAGVKFFASVNNTDSRFDPTCGDAFEFSYEQVFGDYNFGIAEAIYRNFKTLHEDLSERKTVLETKFQAGSIVGDAPIYEKFYAGGTGSLRGFDYRGATPKGENSLVPGKYDDPIGSDWILLGNAEISVPLANDTFAWLFFVDAGMLDDNELRASVGTGIQIQIPQWFGPVPMRFEFAAPFAKDDNDDTQVFSFSVGRLF